jgi:hypothetical protein
MQTRHRLSLLLIALLCAAFLSPALADGKGGKGGKGGKSTSEGTPKGNKDKGKKDNKGSSEASTSTPAHKDKDKDKGHHEVRKETHHEVRKETHHEVRKETHHEVHTDTHHEVHKGDKDHKGHRYHHVKTPCHDEAERLCSDVRPGEGRVTQCLASRRSDLSPDCRAHADRVIDHHDKVAKWQDTCRADINTHCGVYVRSADKHPPGHKHKEILYCLDLHASALSSACAATLPDQKEKQAARIARYEYVRASCSADLQTFCDAEYKAHKAKRGLRGDLTACLISHEPELSQLCRDALKPIRDDEDEVVDCIEEDDDTSEADDNTDDGDTTPTPTPTPTPPCGEAGCPEDPAPPPPKVQ